MKIALIGSYPPPYGGISVHIQRLATHLEGAGIDYVIYDISRILTKEKNIVPINNIKKWLLKYIFFARENVIHYHSPNWFLRAVLGLMSLRGKKTVISIHGESLDDSLKNGGWLRKKIIVFALKHTSFIIADNKEIKKLLLSLDVMRGRIAVIPAFIPPIVKEDDYENVPLYVWDFIKSHKPIISANAWQISFYNGIDLYGIDMCIELISILSKFYPNIGLVFCLPNIGDFRYFERLKLQIKQKGIESNILFITEPLAEVYPIWKESDVFVRPTCTDGDALSVREAIYFKTPTIASDIVPRPKGVTLFKNRNLNDFIQKVKNILNNYEKEKQSLQKIEVETCLGRILKIYNKLGKIDRQDKNR